MPGSSYQTTAAAACILLRLAVAGTVDPLGVDRAACSGDTITVPTTLSNFASASQRVVDALPTYVSNPLNCGYYTCFQHAMNSWSAWQFGGMNTSAPIAAATATSNEASTSAASSPSSQPTTSSSASSATLAPSRRRVATGDFPYSSAVADCCGTCAVWANSAEILYWPEEDEPRPSKASEAAVHALATTVYHGQTLTSPSVYMAITGPFAINPCGSFTTGPSSAIVALPTGDLKRIFYPATGPTPAFTRMKEVLNPTELAGCATATSSQYYLTRTIDGTVAVADRCFPVLEIPTQVVDLEPGWKDCIPALWGVMDPPRALVPAAMPPSPVTSAPAPPPTTTSTSALVQTSSQPPPSNQSSTEQPPSNQPPSDQSPSDQSPSDQSPSDQSPSDHSPSDQQATDQQANPQPENQPPAGHGQPAPPVESHSVTLGTVTTTDRSGAAHTALGFTTAGQTLVAGGPAVTLTNGPAMSLASSVLVASGHPASGPTTVHMADIIMSAFGGSSAPAAPGSDAAAAGFSGNITYSNGTGPVILTGQAAPTRPLHGCVGALLAVLGAVALL